MTNIKETLEKPNNIKYEIYLNELSEDTICKISADQKEPKRMLEHRLNCLKIYNQTQTQDRWPSLDWLDLNDIVRYAKPASDNTAYATDRDDVPQEIRDKFDKLWIPEAEKKYLAWAGWQMDSVNFYHKIKEKRAKVWVIFEDMPTAIQTHPELVKKHFMKLVPPTDHKFAALHGAVRSGWTFIYIPKWVKADEPLQAYFRMNTYAGGQFEHTLIIVDDEAECNYIEWCSAPNYDKSSIHAGVVKIF